MTTKSFSPVQSHGKFKQTKVKTKIINGSPAPVYKGLEAIECLRTCLSYAECSRKSLACKMYKIVNKQVKF